MFLDQLMFKSLISTHNFTVSRMMPVRGLYRKLSETDRARATGCIAAGMRSQEVARRYRTGHQTINRIVQRYRHSGQFKHLPRSGRPRETTRAEDRYVIKVVARYGLFAGPDVRNHGSKSPPCLCENCQKPYPCWLFLSQWCLQRSQISLLAAPMQDGTTLSGEE